LLELLPTEGRDLILAAALLSITINPLVFTIADRLSAWLRTRPDLLVWLERRSDEPLSSLPEETGGQRDHVVIVGYGRVGNVVGKGLKSQGLPIVVIDQDRQRVETLRARGVPTIYGDATTPGVLKAADSDKARLIVIATSEGFQTRRIIELARALNPDIDTAVRSHSEGEVAHMERQGIGIAIMGERELAFGLMEYSLRSLGTPPERAHLIVQNVRVSGEGSAYERELEAPGRSAPELRARREGPRLPE
jgi:monovalent cation:H+ antiporter-2, CPA2 family